MLSDDGTSAVAGAAQESTVVAQKPKNPLLSKGAAATGASTVSAWLGMPNGAARRSPSNSDGAAAGADAAAGSLDAPTQADGTWMSSKTAEKTALGFVIHQKTMLAVETKVLWFTLGLPP